MAYHTIPRVVSEYPMSLTIQPGRPVPVRMRDDLDPHSPPREYADGRLTWSGYPTRDARDEASAHHRARVAQARLMRQDAAERARQQAEHQETARIRARMQTCRHATAVTDADVAGFSGAVSVNENRAAHGNVMMTDRCHACGATRDRNVNQHHEERGPWEVDRDRVRRAGADAQDATLARELTNVGARDDDDW